MKTIRKPIILSVLLTFLIISAPVISGIVISVAGLEGTTATIIQTVAFTIIFILGCVISKWLFGNLREVGLKEFKTDNLKSYLWFLPIVIIELIPLFYGFKNGLNARVILISLLFTTSVGFAEELYFRGLIARVLKQKGLLMMILVSSLLFSTGHIFNLLSGASVTATILQIIFAFVFGIVAIQLSISTGSIIIPIIWHIVHNFISINTVENTISQGLTAGVIQVIIMALYVAYLWIMVLDNNEVIAFK